MNMDKDPFREYLRESEPNKATKGYVWSTAVGLQAVDGLKPSQYLIDTAKLKMAISVNMGTLKCAGRFIFYTFPLLRFSYFQTILISL